MSMARPAAVETASLSMGGTADFEIGNIDTRRGRTPPYSGTIDEVRISSHAPLYTANFTPSAHLIADSDHGGAVEA